MSDRHGTDPRGGRPERLQWDAARARLEASARALEAGGTPSPDAVRRRLEERARALARPPAEPRAPVEELELLVLELAGERYAVESADVVEVAGLRGFTPVPCTPSFMLGVVNHRGRILAVLDLRRVLGLAAPRQEAAWLVALERDGRAFGLLAEAVPGTARIDGATVGAHPTAVAGRHAFVRGVTADGITVLDLDGLLRDPRFMVNEEVG